MTRSCTDDTHLFAIPPLFTYVLAHIRFFFTKIWPFSFVVVAVSLSFSLLTFLHVFISFLRTTSIKIDFLKIRLKILSITTGPGKIELVYKHPLVSFQIMIPGVGWATLEYQNYTLISGTAKRLLVIDK